MTFLEAKLFENRNIITMLFYYISKKFELLNIIFNRDKYESIFLLLSAYTLGLLLDFTMNSLLYNDEFMEKKYNNNGKLDFYSSIILSFSSNIIGACFAWLINKLINYSYVFDLIHNEVKNEKKYFQIIQRVWKIIKRRLIIYIIINIIINFICVYYLTIFCIIYKKSQISLFINYITGNITSIIYML